MIPNGSFDPREAAGDPFQYRIRRYSPVEAWALPYERRGARGYALRLWVNVRERLEDNGDGHREGQHQRRHSRVHDGLKAACRGY